MSFDKKLKALRLENEMTQEYIASRLNVSRSTIAGYETKNRQPSHEKLTALANLFHVSVDYLLDDSNSIQLSTSAGSPCSAEEESLLLRYRKLPVKYRQDFIDYLCFLEQRNKD